MAEVAVEPSHAVEVDRMFVEPDDLHDRLLTGAAQREQQRLIGVRHHIVSSSAVISHRYQTVALGSRGEDIESARPSATRRKVHFICSTNSAIDSRATGLSG